MNKAHPKVSNPGPKWGYQTIAFWERILPSPLFKFGLGIGTAIGMCCMPQQRCAGRAYWKLLKGREPSLREQFRHFRSFVDGLVLKLQAGRNKLPDFQFYEYAHKEAFVELCLSDQPAIFGTFHVGHSDMMGCMLRDFGRKISMVRLKVGNSFDTEEMERIFKDSVHFLWINKPEEFLFSLKETLQQGNSLALQCDRTEYTSRTCPLNFLGESREFPMTIYYLSHMFQYPVVFAFTGPLEKSGKIRIYTSPVFKPLPERKEHLLLARVHYQEVIDSLLSHLHRNPELWFNFIPMDRCFPKVENRDA